MLAFIMYSVGQGLDRQEGLASCFLQQQAGPERLEALVLIELVPYPGKFVMPLEPNRVLQHRQGVEREKLVALRLE